MHGTEKIDLHKNADIDKGIVFQQAKLIPCLSSLGGPITQLLYRKLLTVLG